MNIVFLIATLQNSYTAGESIRVELTIENHGSGPVQLPDPSHPGNWQPVYWISGPGFPKEAAMDFRRGVHQPSQDTPSRTEAVLLDLQPGQKWQDILEIDNLLKLRQPGQFQLRATIEWGNERIESNTVKFTFERFQSAGASCAALGDAPVRTVECAFLHRGASAMSLRKEVFREGKGDDGGIEAQGVERKAELGPKAVDPRVPVTLTDPDTDLFRWIFWREGNRLGGLPSSLDEKIELEIPIQVERVLEPALADSSRAADVVAIGKTLMGRREIVVARFFDPIRSLGKKPAILGRLPLPAWPASIWVGFDRKPGGVTRRIVVSAVEQGQPRLWTLAYADAPLPAFQPLTLDLNKDAPKDAPKKKFAAIPDGPPAVVSHPDGALTVALALQPEGDDRRCLLLRVELDAAGSLKGAPVLKEVEVPAPVVAARLAFRSAGSGSGDLVWALWTRDKAVWTQGSQGPREARKDVPENAPRQLFVLAENNYLLEVGEHSGVRLNIL